MSNQTKKQKDLALLALCIVKWKGNLEKALDYKEIMEKLEQMETGYDKNFKEIFTALKYLLNPEQPPRKKIGYKTAYAK